MAPLEVGGVVASKYRLVRPLAKGGMGSVWVARHVQLDVDVAIKFMASAYAESAEARARFELEAKAAAQLKSPHVVQVHDYGIAEGIPYLVMELLHGEDLSERLRREQRLSLPAAAAVLAPVCRALRRAHDAGIVHRDLKPGNIFLARQDDEESVKVLDFGVAKVTTLGAGAATTTTGALVGSPSYMSPEQVRAKHVDHRSDLWSMGVVLFKAVTGELPFPGDDVGDVLVEVCTAPLPVASQIASDLGPEVDRFFERALARDPAARFQSARELAEAFAVLAGPIDPHPRDSHPSNPGPHDGSAYRPALPSAPVSLASWGTVGSVAPIPATSAGPAPAPSHERRNAIVLGLAGIALVVGIGAATLLRARAPSSAALLPVPLTASAAPPPVVVPSAAPGLSPPSSVAVEGRAAVAAPPAEVSPVTSASARAPVRPPTPLPAKGGPLPDKPRKPTHDPLDRF